MKHIGVIILFFLLSISTSAQVSSTKVVLIGEDEKAYEKVIASCPSSLLEVTGNSMDKAYTLWTDMFASLEERANAEGIDLKGAKIWVNLFWENDGTIKKIAYYPKPNSKNMNFDELTLVLENFSKTYTLPITHDACFSHYGSASFPVFSKLSIQNEK